MNSRFQILTVPFLESQVFRNM